MFGGPFFSGLWGMRRVRQAGNAAVEVVAGTHPGRWVVQVGSTAAWEFDLKCACRDQGLMKAEGRGSKRKMVSRGCKCPRCWSVDRSCRTPTRRCLPGLDRADDPLVSARISGTPSSRSASLVLRPSHHGQCTSQGNIHSYSLGRGRGSAVCLCAAEET